MKLKPSARWSIADAARPALPRRWDACVYFYRLYPLQGLGGRVTADCHACVDPSGISLRASFIAWPEALESEEYRLFEARVARRLRKLGYVRRRRLDFDRRMREGADFGKPVANPERLAEECARLDEIFAAHAGRRPSA